jgi:hypothetical protein
VVTVDHQELARRMADGLGRGDLGVLESLFADDVVAEYPQSGRVLHGLGALKEELSQAARHYAAGVSGIDQASVTGRGVDEHRVVAPMFTVVKVQGRGHAGTITLRTRYPDGTWWWVIVIYELREDRIARSTTFFAEEMEPRDWSSFEPDDA